MRMYARYGRFGHFGDELFDPVTGYPINNPGASQYVASQPMNAPADVSWWDRVTQLIGVGGAVAPGIINAVKGTPQIVGPNQVQQPYVEPPKDYTPLLLGLGAAGALAVGAVILSKRR